MMSLLDLIYVMQAGRERQDVIRLSEAAVDELLSSGPWSFFAHLLSLIFARSFLTRCLWWTLQIGVML